jgi:chromosome partitioning protein
MTAAVIPIANEAGSAGKTTSTVEFAANLAEIGKRVLVVDADSQHNASHILGISDPKFTTGDVLLRRADITDAIVESNTRGVWVLPSAETLKSDKFELIRVAVGAEQRLRQSLGQVDDDFDHVLIDCAGSLDTLTIAALVATRGTDDGVAFVITVVQPMVKEIEGIPRLLSTIEDIAGAYNPQLRLGCVIPCLVPPHNQGSIYQEAIQLLDDSYRDLVTPPVRRSVTVPEAYFRRQPLRTYAPRAAVTSDYHTVFKHLRKRGIL